MIVFSTAALPTGALSFGYDYFLFNKPCAVIVAGDADVRAGPNHGFAVDFQLREGSMTETTGRLDEFTQVRLNNGLNGWVESRFLQDIL
jgi:uncharacterized protein YraI